MSWQKNYEPLEGGTKLHFRQETVPLLCKLRLCGGHAGSSGDAALQRVNKRLWASAFLRVLSMRDVPCFRCGDF